MSNRKLPNQNCLTFGHGLINGKKLALIIGSKIPKFPGHNIGKGFPGLQILKSQQPLQGANNKVLGFLDFTNDNQLIILAYCLG
jgi:hypothetical protein